MGKAREPSAKPVMEPIKLPPKPRKKKGEGKWVQVNIRLTPDEYELFLAEAEAMQLTAPGLAKKLVDDHMAGLIEE